MTESIWIIFLRPVWIPIVVNIRKFILSVLQLQWDGREIINNGITDLMWIMHLCNVSFSSYHFVYQGTIELFYSEVTVHNSICFNIRRYLRFSWGDVILDRAQSQGPHQWSTSVSIHALPSDVFFPCWGFSPWQFLPAHSASSASRTRYTPRGDVPAQL